MSAVVNPTHFTISDPTFTNDQVTGMTIEVGTTTGGPYTQSFAVPSADISAQSGGTVTGALSGITNWTFANGTYYAVVTATNSSGTSKASPEASFQSLSTPSAPVSLAFS